jgi:hypothetical protein
MSKKNKKVLTLLIVIAIFDTLIPIPILGIILIYVAIEKPAWFKNVVTEVYS